MKIAMIGARGIANRYGGIETHLEELCPRLVQMGHEVTVFTRSYFTKAREYRGVNLTHVPTIKTKHLDTLAHSFLSTMLALRADVDVVHFHALGPSLFTPLARMAGKKTVVTVHGLDWQRDKWGKAASWFLKQGEYASAKFPTATIVVSKSLQQYYREHYPNSNVFYVPNGVAVSSPVPPRRIRQFGLGKRDYMLFVGRLTPEKGCHLLMDAYRRIRTEVKLVVAGGSAHTDGYAESLRRNGNGHALFLGAVQPDLLGELYSNAYLFVLPSLMEGLSICLLEAMSHGLCVVASNIPANIEVVEQDGLVFVAGDHSSLADTLCRALNDPNMVYQLGAAAKQKVRQEYDWDVVADQTEAVYLSIL
ncbi:MAG: glycosyltransferase family 4 protein [Chloroflexi bacterium]|nr:glycosyltransferase family 4 protein [Chloroflexota bacterium]